MAASDADPLIEAAAARLRAGELVVMPTETVYGLAADASNPDAVAKIFALKGRPSDRPLIVHIPDASRLDEWARAVPDYARTLAARFWPGPLSLVLPRTSRVPDVVTGGQDTVALRVPAHPVARALLARFGGGVAAPSANRYGRISPTTPAHVRAQFGDATPLLLDGGACTVGIESTIVACLDAEPRVLRPGSISSEEIAAALGRPVTVSRAGEAVRTAGQDRSHYAPATPAYLVPRGELAEWRAAHPGRCGFLGFSPPGFDAARDLRLPSDPGEAARMLYAALHELDSAGLECLVVEEPPAPAEWAAVRDRLARACRPWR